VVLASSSTDGGVTWSGPALLAAPDSFFENVELSRFVGSADGMRLIAFWSTTRAREGDLDFFHFLQSSRDGGATWSAPAIAPSLQQVGVGQVMVHVAMEAAEGIRLTAIRLFGDTQVMQALSSTDGGVTWSMPADVCNARTSLLHVVGSADGTRLTIVWHVVGEDGLWASSSADRGATWSPPAKWSLPIPDPYTSETAIVATPDGIRLAAAWNEPIAGTRTWHGSRIEPSIVRAASSADGGATWSAPVDLSAANEHFPAPVIAISDDGARLTAVWYLATWSRRTGNSLLMAAPWTSRYHFVVQASSSDDGGATWSLPCDLSEAGELEVPLQRLAASADGTRLTVLWRQTDTWHHSRVEAAFSTTGGRDWSGPMDLSLPGYRAIGHQLAVAAAGTEATAVWYQTADPYTSGTTDTDYGEPSTVQVCSYSIPAVRPPEATI
jgi:Neuraminidase (sialidase)